MNPEFSLFVKNRNKSRRPDHMIPAGHCPFSMVLLFWAFASAAPLSDSLPIGGHYFQSGNEISNYRLEKFLLTQDSSKVFTDNSLGFRWSGHAVGGLLWCVNAGVTAYEITQLYDAIKDQSLFDAAGHQVPISNSLDRLTVPVTIGTDIAAFVQTRLYNRADYLLHKGALAYNESLAKKYSREAFFDLRIDHAGWGAFRQGGLTFGESVLHSVLLERPESSAHSAWSWIFKETGIQEGSWGGMYLGLAIISYLQENMGDTAFVIDKKSREINLTAGISLVACSIASAIVSSAIRNRGIERYNETVAKRPAFPPDSAVPQH